MAVEQMQAALPFEKDVQRKRELQREIENNLALLSERGDFHNLGFQVHAAAKRFSTKYAPIKQNYEAYQGALSGLKERLDKGEINPEQYALAPAWMVGGYKGFEEDPETGRPKEGTMFSPKTVYKDPKTMDRLTERLQILREKKTGSKITKIGVGPDGKYTETVGNTVSQIPQEDVEEVLNAVLQEPDVQAYVSQLADMKAYNVSSSGKQVEMLNSQRAAIVKNIDQLTQVENSKKYSAGQKKQVGEMKKQMEAELAKLDATMSSTDPAMAYDYLKSKFAQEIVQPLRDFASLKAGVFENTTEYAQDYDKYWMAKETERLKNATGTPFYTNVDVTADKVFGRSVGEKQSNILEIDAQLKELDATINNPNISNDQKAKARHQKFALAGTKTTIKNQIAQAAEMALTVSEITAVDPKLVGVYRKLFPNVTAGELYSKLISDDPTVIAQVQKEFNRYYGPGAFEVHTSGPKSQEKLPPGAIAAPLMLSPGLHAESKYPPTFGNVASMFMNKFDLKVNKKFIEIKNSNLYNFGDVEAGDQTQAVTKAADEFFLGKPLHPTLLVIDGSDGQERFGSDYADATVVARGYDPMTDTWSLHLEGKDNSYSKIVTVSTGQISNPQLEAVLSRPEVRFAGIVSKFKPQTNGAINSLDITGTVQGKTTLLKLNIESRGTNGPLVWITFPDGTPYFDKKIVKRGMEEPEMQALIYTLEMALD
jgi:hypothetical protein